MDGLCVQVGRVFCIYDVVVVASFDVTPVVGVDGVIDLIGGRVIDGLAIFSADSVEFDVSVNLGVCVCV